MKVEEYGKYIQILGYWVKGTIDPKTFIEDARNRCRPSIVQFFDADTLAGEKHLFFATLHAIKAFIQGRNFAQTLDIEILLYASAQRQIGEAIRKIGLRPNTSAMALVVVGDDEKTTLSAVRRLESLIPGVRDQSVLETITREKLAYLTQIYGVSKAEFGALSGVVEDEALQWLIVEQVALLDARR
jgi:tRNA threonylcarbamoyladenosine modification (KEOPS) complex Cgi121 subunit